MTKKPSLHIDSQAAEKFIGEIEQDIHDFIRGREQLLYNERDFQMHLAIFLKEKGAYDKIDVEYSLPKDFTQTHGYEWGGDLRLDIVVEKDGMFAVVELKYTTKGENKRILRFNSPIGDVKVIRDHYQQNYRRYDFWKDVRRIERVKEWFPESVVGGVAVMLTNDASYLKVPRKGVDYEAFSIAKGRVVADGSRYMSWKDPKTKSYPPIRLDGNYLVQWEERDIEGITFHYTTLRVFGPTQPHDTDNNADS